jgi:uncharacterized RDD family membrane protein YckC
MKNVGGRVPSRVAAKMLFAASIVDLLFLYLIAIIAASFVLDMIGHFVSQTGSTSVVFQNLLNKDAAWAQFVSFIVLFALYQILSETALGGRTIGRTVLGLHMCDDSGTPARQTKRMARGIRKLSSLGILGLQIGDLPRYDRSGGIFWHNRMVPRKVGPIETWRVVVEIPGKAPKSKRLGDFAEFRRSKTLRIGRDAHWADLVLPTNTKASGRHCQLSFQNGIIRLNDLGSTNGTFVKSNRIKPNTWVTLPSNSKFQVSNVAIKIIQ